jgi:2-keto-4-pentenoate hydratase/2-oxohepta-3-ene-1,7-dioic acid hydratase in catechol pathway
MKVARYSHDGQVSFGIVDDNYLIQLKGHPLVNQYETTGERVLISDVKLLAPTLPSKVVCVGKNYGAHIAEMGLAASAEPTLFFKPNSAIVGHGDTIMLPHQSSQVEVEVELAIVIGQLTKNVAPEQALNAVWGYTVANDVTARDLQFTDDQWARSKAFDTFCPLGPWIETDWIPGGQRIWSEIDGQVAQDSKIDQMIHGVAHIVSYVSQNMTLLPGDVILTGTPAGITKFESGQTVTCSVEGIGSLKNSVAR